MSIDAATEAVRAAVDSIPDDKRPEASEVVEFVLQVVDEAKAHFDGVDPKLVSPAMTERINAALEALASQTQAQSAVTEGPNWGLVRDGANSVLDALPLLPSIRSEDVEVVTSRDRIERLSARSQEIEQHLEELSEEVNATLATLGDQVTENRAQHEARDTELRQRTDELAAVIDTQKTALSESLDKQQTAFRTDQEQRRTEHTAAIDELRDSMTSEVEEFRKATATEREDTEKKTKAHLNELKRILSEATKVHGAVGRTAMASGYQEQAAQEEKHADRFRKYAIWFGLAAVVVLVAAIVFAAVGTNINTLLAKVVASTALGTLATYAAKQSGDHRSTARRLRSTYLAIASLGPYLATIKDEKVKEQVVRTFAYIFFAAPQQGESPDESIQTVKALMDMAQQLGKPEVE